MTIIEYPPPLNRAVFEQAMKPDERIVCTNATVVMDSNDNITYFRNDAPICILKTKEDEL